MSGQGESFTCANCGGVFLKNRSDEDAIAEAKRIFSAAELSEGPGLADVCDECWEVVLMWKALNSEAREN